MQPLPLPVDVVSSTLDTFVDYADIFAGFGTLGALIYAGRTFNKQLNDARRAQASLIVCSYVSEQSRNSIMRIMSVENYSTMPIFNLRIAIIPPEGSKYPVVRPRPIYKLDPGKPTVVETPVNEPGQPHAIITFTDAAGLHWRRTSFGDLRRYKRQRWWHHIRAAEGQIWIP